MIILALLLIVYILLITVSYHTSYKHNLICPQIGFLIGFFLQVCYAFGWVKIWDLNLSSTTFFALIIGTTVYTLTCIAVQRFLLHTTYNAQTVVCKVEVLKKKIIVDKWKLLVFILIQCITLAGCIFYLRSLNSGSLSQAIFYYHKAVLNPDLDVRLPSIIGFLRTFTKPSGCFWLYIFLHGIIYKYNNNKALLLVNIILSFFINIIIGGRGGAIRMVLAAIVMVYIIMQFRMEWNFRIKPSTLIKVFAVVTIVAVLFPITGNLIGRPITQSSSEYIAIYLSAELKNLDTFVREGQFGQGNSLYTTQTLVYLVNGISGRFGLPNWGHEAINTYRFVNGHTLGNVSTTFYAFLYDGGFFALIVYTSIMAALTSLIFITVYKTRKSSLDMGIIIYAYLFYDVVFSFFGDKFYDLVIAKGFLYTLLSLLVLYLFVRVRVKIRQ